MDPKTARQLDRLLADGEPSRPEADAIFDRVYTSVAREQRSRPVPWAGAWAAGALAAATLLFFGLRPFAESRAPLTARGSGATSLVLELRCTGGTLAACPLSSSLVFVVAGSAEAGFLSAYAEPLSAGAERVWYFSRETNSPELPGPLDGTHVFDRAVQLIGSHRAGRYRVHAFVSEQPLARAELLSLRPNRRVHTSLHAEITLTAGD